MSSGKADSTDFRVHRDLLFVVLIQLKTNETIFRARLNLIDHVLYMINVLPCCDHVLAFHVNHLA